MRIRRAEPRDSGTLAQIQVDSYRAAYAGILPQPYLDHFTYQEQERDWNDLLSAPGSDILIVAESASGEILGYALARPGGAEMPHYDGELVSLYVRHSSQGQGVGQRLITAAASELQDAGCRSLMLWVLDENPARGLYEHLGARLLAEKDWGGNEHFRTTVREVAYGWPKIQALCGGAPDP